LCACSAWVVYAFLHPCLAAESLSPACMLVIE
jgi:hypothetical protein